ncbi:hypothetical protein CYY_009657 [Polysphondylium violaceum]|uniref:Uncharacterized protein n=1 Tax=Polysphondylium violaceum TaxID=133409 RepID=A0A8J4PTA9_9MYCE|nr:hypothetical protein CYY_009657 [Polysphondylium violaceum]
MSIIFNLSNFVSTRVNKANINYQTSVNFSNTGSNKFASHYIVSLGGPSYHINDNQNHVTYFGYPYGRR